MPKQFMITIFALGLAWTNTGHALEEMFPEQAPQSATSNPLAQLGLGVAEMGAAAALVPVNNLLQNPVEKALARITRKMSKASVAIQKIELQRIHATPANQSEAIRVSLATREYQFEVLRAQKEVEYAQRLLTASERAQIIEEERLMAMAAGSNGMGMYAGLPYPVRDYDWRSYREVTPEVKLAEQTETELALRKAQIQLDEALIRVKGTREQIERFPISRGESALRVELEHVQSPAFAVIAAENEQRFVEQIQGLEKKIKALDAKSLRILNSNPNVREKIMSHLHIPVTAILGGAILTDYLLRFYLYYQGRDPGYAPFAKVITKEIEAMK